MIRNHLMCVNSVRGKFPFAVLARNQVWKKKNVQSPFGQDAKLSLSERLADFIIISKPRFVKTLLTLRARWGVGQLVLRRSTVPDESTF